MSKKILFAIAILSVTTLSMINVGFSSMESLNAKALALAKSDKIPCHNSSTESTGDRYTKCSDCASKENEKGSGDESTCKTN